MSQPARHRVGVLLEQRNLSPAETLARAGLADELGVDSQWLVQLPNQRDSVVLLAAMAARTGRSGIGSAILPLYSRPPVVMAHTALTLDELSGGRFTLGLGLGHRGVGEWMVGAGTTPPAVAGTREYLQITTSLIRDGEVSHDGKWFSGHASYTGPRRDGLAVHVGAFGPKLLELAGELADGAILWMCTPGYVREHAVPALRRGLGRRADGRYPGGAGFEVAVVLNAAVTPEPEADRAGFHRYLSAYLRVPTYRRLFTASGFGAQVGAGRPDDEMVRALTAIGAAENLRSRMDDYAAAGATRMLISPTVSAHFDTDRFAGTLRGGLG
ncbi:LLM class flavin-dependent oxidoreductase [Planotetraspora sp. GP83]|uniref:LLM class flavin-dependent oxidoreductase n=1 Tax=Planotetraspora sp. GP83 TaxID=3156264 RepID=UPI00351846F5